MTQKTTSRSKQFRPRAAKNSVKLSEQILLIVLSLVMALGALCAWGSTLIIGPFVVLMVLNILIYTGNLASETAKRFIIFLSILGALLAAGLIYTYLSIANGGLTF